MDDLHFLERLDRVAAHEVELALALYRDPQLVKLILAHEAPPDAARVAISLRDPVVGPFLVVQRSGRFVTCLGEGMRTELPVVTRARLDNMKRVRADVRERMTFVEATDDKTLSRMWRVMLERAHLVPREVMTTLTMIAPLLGSTVFDAYTRCTRRLLTELNDGPRLAARIGRWSAHDLATAEEIWRDVWTLSHLLLLDFSGPREELAERQLRRERDPDLALARAFGVPSAIAFGPVQIRMAWAAARLGPRFAGEAREMVELMRTFPAERNNFALALLALAHAHPETFDDTVEGLVATAKRYGASTLARLARCMLVGDRLAAARAMAFATANDFSDLDTPDAETLQAASMRPEALSRIQLGATFAANSFRDALDDKHLDEVAIMLPWLVSREPDELYWCEGDLQRFERPWQPAFSEALLRSMARSKSGLVAIQREPVVAFAKPGRNDACVCGSGKKYKRCCGA